MEKNKQNNDVTVDDMANRQLDELRDADTTLAKRIRRRSYEQAVREYEASFEY